LDIHDFASPNGGIPEGPEDMPPLRQAGTPLRFTEFTTLPRRNFSVAPGFIPMQGTYGKSGAYEERLKMRKYWATFVAIGFLGVATLAWAGILTAQEPAARSTPPEEETTPNGKQGRGGTVDKRLENLSKQLNLTNEQKAKIAPLLKHEVERIKEVRSNSSLSQGEAQRRIRSIRRDTNQRISEFLTPEQKTQWQESRQAQRGSGPGRQHGSQGSGAPDAPPAPPRSN
jgi:Spy/CpxP family protein refolding chaperone